PEGTASTASEALPPCRLLHRLSPIEFSMSSDEFLTIEERRRGELIHRLLFFIDFTDRGIEEALQEAISRVAQENGPDLPAEETKAAITALLRNREMACYFEQIPGREIRREQEYADSAGRLFRMDRVVIDADSVTVIDYKTGKDKGPLDIYRGQMGNYMRILADVYPGKRVEGIIAFVDLNDLEKMA
ncbi:MAG: hypothetical protein HGA78_06655, partial [Nitrospirales bacterium]|nr:hypothetical protein [Nitrospirales bacterium]